MKKSDHHLIKKDEKVCYNCKHRIWLVGLGLGVRCGNPTTISDKDKVSSFPIIISLRHTCDKFEFNT